MFSSRLKDGMSFTTHIVVGVSLHSKAKKAFIIIKMQEICGKSYFQTHISFLVKLFLLMFKYKR